MNPIFLRLLLTIGLLLFGIGVHWLVNRMIVYRAGKKHNGLDGYNPGKPAVLYFTMEGCVPCKTIQRPALEKLSTQVDGQVQIIQVDVVSKPELAESWGVLSVPTTFIIDPKGRPRRVNHGVAMAEKLLNQLEEVTGRKLVRSESREAVEIHATTSGMD